MKNKRTPTAHWNVRVSLALLAVAPLAASCSIVDTPTDSPQVTDVSLYYAKLATPKMQYHYGTTFRPMNGAAAAPDTLRMKMSGRVEYPTYPTGMPTYECGWKFLVSGWAPDWYYGLSADSAVDFGDSSFDEHWTDLRAPLATGASWTFTRKTGEMVTAKVTQFGATVKLGDRQFSNVIAVDYTGDKGTTSTRWFAKDIGLIFSHTADADGTVREEKFMDMGMAD